MTRSEWEALAVAKELLGLPDRVTRREIKRSYHKKCLENHPDIVGEDQGKAEIMRGLTRASELLMSYCDQFKIPLVPLQDEDLDPEDWWMDRFGHDPLWGKK